MARVKKLNRIMTIPDADVSSYLANGYTLMSTMSAQPTPENVELPEPEQSPRNPRKPKEKQPE